MFLEEKRLKNWKKNKRKNVLKGVVSLLKAISSIAEITKDLVQDLQIEHGVVAGQVVCVLNILPVKQLLVQNDLRCFWGVKRCPNDKKK